MSSSSQSGRPGFKSRLWQLFFSVHNYIVLTLFNTNVRFFTPFHQNFPVFSPLFSTNPSFFSCFKQKPLFSRILLIHLFSAEIMLIDLFSAEFSEFCLFNSSAKFSAFSPLISTILSSFCSFQQNCQSLHLLFFQNEFGSVRWMAALRPGGPGSNPAQDDFFFSPPYNFLQLFIFFSFSADSFSVKASTQHFRRKCKFF